MKEVSTILELKAALHGEDQNYKTRCGWVLFHGKKYYVRKHWSYDGGYPAYYDENCTQDAGEFFGTGDPIPAGEYQGARIFDRKLTLKK